MDCLIDSQRESVQKECKWCGETFTTIPSSEQKICSQECAMEYMKESFSGKDSHFWKEKTEVPCEICGETMYLSEWELDRKVVCSRKCYSKYISENYSGENSWHWKGGREDDYGSDWDGIAENIREKYNRKCQLCGGKSERRKISVHHIIPVREFDDVSNSHFDENLVALCESCHSVVEQTFTLGEQIEAFNRDPDKLQI
jgi:5-methylcytosine-specific restriction endonuclease McrA